MKVHWLKTWPEQFAAVRSGAKLHEVRRNDRDFAGCPYVGPDFVTECARVGALWNDPAAEAERQEIWRDSTIFRKGSLLVMALDRKGFVLPCAVEILEKKRSRQ